MAEEPLAEAIAERTGTDPHRDLFPRVMAGAIAAAVRVAGRHWIAPGTTDSFAAVLHRALACVLPAAAPNDQRTTAPDR